jgi:16S rRNA (guanine(966)-N(2))-methyltransferase RsmD
MKVISGTLKGRNIIGFDTPGTRPTMDRVKESLFGMIQDYIKGSTVLDLFSGSGNLGIEAISNGAKYCYFIDHSVDAIKVIKENTHNFNIMDKCNIILSDWKKALNSFKGMKFDIIFVDPPYEYDVYEKVMNKVNELELLNKNGLIILEHANLKLKDTYDNLSLYKSKKYGNKTVNVYKLH